MSLPVPPNTTCDIYRAGNAPPAAPHVTAVSCLLRAAYALGLSVGRGDGVAKQFTHVLLVGEDVDIRDGWDADSVTLNADTVYVPDKNGTPFKVVFVEPLSPATAQAHRRVFLSRKRPSWPTKEL